MTSANDPSFDGNQPKSQKSTSEAPTASELKRRAQRNDSEVEVTKRKLERKSAYTLLTANNPSFDGNQPKSQKSTSEAPTASELKRRAQRNDSEVEVTKRKLERKSAYTLLVEEAIAVRPEVARYLMWSFLGSLLFFLVIIAASGIWPSNIDERIVDQAFKLVQIILPLMTLVLGFYFGKSHQ